MIRSFFVISTMVKNIFDSCVSCMYINIGFCNERQTKAVDTGVGGKEDLRTVAGLLGILW